MITRENDGADMMKSGFIVRSFHAYRCLLDIAHSRDQAKDSGGALERRSGGLCQAQRQCSRRRSLSVATFHRLERQLLRALYSSFSRFQGRPRVCFLRSFCNLHHRFLKKFFLKSSSSRAICWVLPLTDPKRVSFRIWAIKLNAVTAFSCNYC